MKALRLIADLLRHPVGANALSLYSIQLARQLLPFITLPFLARVLQPDAFGLLVLGQALGLWLSALLEYGFVLSATRQVATNRDDPHALTEIARSVMSAKLLLAGLSFGVVPIALASLEHLSNEAPLVLSSWVFAVSVGFSPFWFFQGVQRLRNVALLDLGTRILAAAALLILVRGPDQAWLALAIQALFASLAMLAGHLLMYRQVRFARPTAQAAYVGLRSGWSMFVFRGAVSLYTTANAFILGLFAAPDTVAMFGGAERLARGTQVSLSPLSQALFPHMSKMAGVDPRRAAIFTTKALTFVPLIGILISAMVFASAPFLISVFLGTGYEQAVPLLRIMIWMLPLVSVGNILGIQWMIPMGRDTDFNVVIVVAGLLNIALAVITVPVFGAMGMAVVVLLAEVVVVLALNIVLAARQIHPVIHQSRLANEGSLNRETQ